MVEGVAQQVPERRFECRQDVAIDLGRLADDLEPRLLAERVGDVADHAWKRLHTVGERPHPAGQRLVVQAVRQVERSAIEHLELDEPLGQELMTLQNGAPHPTERGVALLVEGLGRDGLVEAVHEIGAFVVHAFEAPK